MTWSSRAYTRIVATLNGVPTDITEYVLTVGSLGERLSSFRGRQTQLSGMNPSTFSMRLKNMDHRFTPGNASSPYFPYWRMGVPILWTETIGARTFTHFDGFIEIPEMSLTFQTAEDPSVNDSTVTVNAVDTLTWLGRQQPFLSTLAGHILWAGGTDLAAYWPLGEASGSKAALPQPIGSTSTYALRPDFNAGPFIEFGTSTSVTADDMPTMLFTPNADGEYVRLTVASDVSPPVAKSLSIWVMPDATLVDAIVFTVSRASSYSLAIGTDANGLWTGDVSNIATIATVTSSQAAAPGVWQLVTVTVEASSINIYVNRFSDSASLPFGGATPTFNRVWVSGASGNVADAQMYTSAIANTQHLAQFEAGVFGLERQTTGERIRTILGYAGIAESAMDAIDTGSSFMSAASLAGKTPLAAMEESSTTEQGRLFSAGNGSITFHDRHRIYDT